jgi:hypothetical protein
MKMPRSRAKTAYGLLMDVKRIILEEPRRLHMGLVCIQDADTMAVNGLARPECGTVGCIAGWVNVLSESRNVLSVWDAAVTLGINYGDTGDELFCPDFMNEQPQTKAHARKTAKHIDRFVAKHKKHLMATRITK